MKFFVFDVRRFYPYFRKSISYALLAFFATAYMQVDTLIIKHYLGTGDVGIYQAGMRILLAAMLISNVFNSIYLPRAVILKEKKSKDMLINLQRRAFYLLTFLGMLGVIFSLFLSKQLTIVLYGAQYIDLVKYLPIFAFIAMMRYSGAAYSVLPTVFDNQFLRCIFLLSTFTVNIIS
ncbi:lipopolysaccharide biosynthesis protein, partial [Piscirickettsia litoralis]|uniref:lipopolysaccharide biosynthesis protein n=1 Tax=Piscirickettsia litoralis TaxID=1891921 RepID=UPI0013013401